MQEHTILLPSKLKIVKEDEQNGVYEIEGLYPGYGHTLGNTLRRIILSSIPGAAITMIKIEGATHEFSTVEGVKEDLVNLILNFKKVRFHMDGDEPQVVTISAKGPKVITAADIQVSGGIEVMNPDQYIGEVTGKGTNFNVEITVEKGLGFMARDMRMKEKMSIGTVALDAIFTPIRKASYEVSDMRVGDRTDHNRLKISIQTDGSIAPKDALEQAIKTMIIQLRAVIDLKDLAENTPVIPRPDALVQQIAAQNNETDTDTGEASDESEEKEQSADYTDILKTRIDTLDFSTRTLNALMDANIRTIGGLVKKTEDELLELGGLGKKAVEEIQEVLSSFDISLKS